jgi:hypothetical protein
MFLTIPEQTLRKWRHYGYGPAWIKVGRHVRYDSDVVMGWLEAQSSGTDAA